MENVRRELLFISTPSTNREAPNSIVMQQVETSHRKSFFTAEGSVARKL